MYDTPIVEGGSVFTHSILEICGVTLEDEGYYSCEAYNLYGRVSSSFYIDVNDEGIYTICLNLAQCLSLSLSLTLSRCSRYRDSSK